MSPAQRPGTAAACDDGRGDESGSLAVQPGSRQDHSVHVRPANRPVHVTLTGPGGPGRAGPSDDLYRLLRDRIAADAEGTKLGLVLVAGRYQDVVRGGLPGVGDVGPRRVGLGGGARG